MANEFSGQLSAASSSQPGEIVASGRRRRRSRRSRLDMLTAPEEAGMYGLNSFGGSLNRPGRLAGFSPGYDPGSGMLDAGQRSSIAASSSAAFQIEEEQKRQALMREQEIARAREEEQARQIAYQNQLKANAAAALRAAPTAQESLLGQRLQLAEMTGMSPILTPFDGQVFQSPRGGQFSRRLGALQVR